MKLELSINTEDRESIACTLPVPISYELKMDIDNLKKLCGKSVNREIRKFIRELVEQNRDKLAKAS